MRRRGCSGVVSVAIARRAAARCLSDASPFPSQGRALRAATKKGGPRRPPSVVSVCGCASGRLLLRREAAVEGFVLGGHVAQKLRNLEAVAVFGGQVVGLGHESLQSG